MAAPLRRVVVKRPQEAFKSSEMIERDWNRLGYTRPPDLIQAIRQHEQFVSILSAAGAEVLYLPSDERTGMDSIYTHDPVLITEGGAIILQTGKAARRGEGPAFASALKRWNVPLLGVLEGAATAEAGDMVWLDRRTLLVGHGFRTNAAGIDKLAALLRPLDVSVIDVQLPYGDGPAAVLHLMSFISLIDENLAVVYRRMMPVPLFELLTNRGFQFVDVPDEEYPTLGCNVLALSPRKAVIVSGNSTTRTRLESAGCTVVEFNGSEICLPGAGGPTCLTRPLGREDSGNRGQEAMGSDCSVTTRVGTQ